MSTQRVLETELNRRNVVAHILRDRRDALVITSLGNPTFDVAAAGDVPQNFYLWGACAPGCDRCSRAGNRAKDDSPVEILHGDGAGSDRGSGARGPR